MAGDTEGWINRRRRRPRVFLSYRHAEAQDGEEAAQINASHRAWVEQFASDLAEFEIEVVWDKLMQDVLRKRTNVDPACLPFSAEISRICPAICHAFVPILTPRYLERIGIIDGTQENYMLFGGVQEEWLTGTSLASNRSIDVQSVLRSGQPEDFDPVPYLYKRHGMMDMRPGTEAHYVECLQKLAGRLHFERHHEDPPIDMELEGWINLYFDWCQLRYKGCAAMPIGAWPWYLGRPLEFLNDCAEAQGAIGLEASASDLLGYFNDQEKPSEEQNWTSDLRCGLLSFGKNGEGWDHLKSLVDACCSALSEGTVTESGADYGKLHHNLSMAMVYLAKVKDHDVWLPSAIAASETALGSFDRSADPVVWSKVMSGLGDAFLALGKCQAGTSEIESALEKLSAALQECQKEQNVKAWAQIESGRVEAQFLLGARCGDVALVNQARDSAAAVIEALENSEPAEESMVQVLWTPEMSISRMKAVITASTDCQFSDS